MILIGLAITIYTVYKLGFIVQALQGLGHDCISHLGLVVNCGDIPKLVVDCGVPPKLSHGLV